MDRLGGRIKVRREVLGLSLSKVARLSGISPSALSQIENGKAFPSIVTLKSIADTLNTTVGDMIGENEIIKFSPLMCKADRKLIEQDKNGGELYQLSHHENGKLMGTFLIKLKKGAVADKWFREHSGQSFCYLLTGELQFEIDDTVYSLRNGDSLYFNAMRRHKAVNKISEVAELIYVVTPPEG